MKKNIKKQLITLLLAVSILSTSVLGTSNFTPTVSEVRYTQWANDKPDQLGKDNDIVNIGLHFILKNVRPYAASCSEA